MSHFSGLVVLTVNVKMNICNSNVRESNILYNIDIKNQLFQTVWAASSEIKFLKHVDSDQTTLKVSEQSLHC